MKTKMATRNQTTIADAMAESKRREVGSWRPRDGARTATWVKMLMEREKRM
jgi:hypothetical protein